MEKNLPSKNKDPFSPMYKDYYFYSKRVTIADMMNPAELSEIADYNTPYPSIYEDNYTNREYFPDPNINHFTNSITEDRFKQIVACCTSGLLYSIFETVKYEFRDHKDVLQCVGFMVNIKDKREMVDLVSKNVSYNVNCTDYYVQDMIRDIVCDFNNMKNAVRIQLFVDTVVAGVYHELHNIILANLCGYDPAIFSKVMNIVTRCIIVYHDNLNMSICCFIDDLSHNKEYMLANNIVKDE